ncbi:MAG TPA: sigma-54 dependent transcriptional regulator [Candidatus Saccharimonadales bacterium]|nr:sigma-54 dependent transcriptional regulator [Candidatus Saccharimonadales bacterium]
MPAGRILVVDDDPGILEVLGDRLRAQGHAVRTASDGVEALESIETSLPDVILLDLQMPRMGGLALLRKLGEEERDITVVVVTAVGTIERAVEAMKHGAYDFITKPFNPEQVTLTVGKALEREGLKRTNRLLRDELSQHEVRLVGEDPRMAEIVATARRAAASRSTVLILGESGTGKEVLARALHAWSARRDAPFVAVNCVALTEELLESELFGHEKGSFTGAVSRKAGKFEVADGGTVFLDEIAEIRPQLQAKLLRALQEHQFERVGGTTSISVDIRVIAATNRDLKSEIDAGRFREDLFYRLNVISLNMPPLRERPGDIEALAAYFQQRYAKETKRTVHGISPDALEALRRYDWPGNVRELQNTIERALVLGSADEILLDDLPTHIVESPVGPEGDDGLSFHGRVRRYKGELIRDAIRSAGGHHRKAATLLGLNPTYLSRLIRTLGLKE